MKNESMMIAVFACLLVMGISVSRGQTLVFVFSCGKSGLRFPFRGESRGRALALVGNLGVEL